MLDQPARADLDALFPPGGALDGRLFGRLIEPEDPEEAPLPPGTRVGRWRVGEVLGRGGSAMVYLAERADGHFAQRAALKIVRPDRALIERFRRERQILADLCHPSIARLIDGGQLGDGRLWLAMEPVLGERIDEHVRRRRLPLDTRLVLFEAVCEAVGYAHDRGLVHRDIKPGNLLVDDSGRPRLIDFGIASSGEPDPDRAHAMTPIYASPEQRAGMVVTAASDIYQLGMLLLLLLMPGGEPCRSLPRPPRASMAKAIASIAERATDVDAARRYTSACALSADVAAARRRSRVPERI